jgi:hypothetical protein
VRKRKRQKRSPYLCFLALFILLGEQHEGSTGRYRRSRRSGRSLNLRFSERRLVIGTTA